MVVQSGAYKSFCLLSPTSSSIKYQVSISVLKQLSDGVSTTKDGNEFHKLTTLSVKIISNITLENVFCNLYILPLARCKINIIFILHRASSMRNLTHHQAWWCIILYVSIISPLILIHPAVWTHNKPTLQTGQTDRQTVRQTGQRSDITGRTVLQTVFQSVPLDSIQRYLASPR